ncbi:MAG TPA: bacitracin ABC transporter ATP-binding protein [Firmicutes bacterium]|nr:bacitracin ABC transporter ATP-binding protein [Bacillota bacterium]
MSAVLKLENVSKTMDKKQLVHNISFEINAGEIFGFLGPNGAGKTTTIKMITGLYKMSEGEVYINGKSVKKQHEQALASVGGIIENPEMYGYLSGRDNLKIYARMHGGISKERIEEVIKLVKLENRIDDKVSKYSLGMRQRLGVAQALLHKPSLLILDEPTNGLDPMGIKELREMLRELADNENLAVLVSSHLLSEMELMCDRFGIIDNGKMIDFRTKESIQKNQNQEIKTYLIEVDNAAKAVELLNEKFNHLSIELEDESIKVSCEKSVCAQVNKYLVMNDILVYGLTNVSKSLEDEFMQITEGSKKQIR